MELIYKLICKFARFASDGPNQIWGTVGALGSGVYSVGALALVF